MTDKKRWVIMIVVSVVVALGCGALIFFQRKHVSQRRDQIASLKTQIQEDRELIKSTPDLIKEVIIQRETDAVIKEILSDEEGINNFVRTLREFEQESGVSIQSIKQQRGRTGNAKKESFDRVGYTLNFDADAFELLAFLDKVESHSRLMSVTAFKLSAARRTKKDEGKPRHKVQMDLETYVYAPKEGAKDARIDHYERKRDLLISEISKRTSELQVPRYDYAGPRGRRDPWVDPRVPVIGENGAPTLSIEEQIAIVDELAKRAQEARGIWQDVEEAGDLISEMKSRALLEEKLALLETDVRRVEAENQLAFVPASRRFENEVVAVIRELRDPKAGGSGGGPSIVELREMKEAMERHIEASEFELALKAFETIENRLPMAEKDANKLAHVQALRELQRLASTVLEFEAITIDVGGIAIYEDRRPVALINGTPVAEGELLDQELLVRNIRKDQIEFAFRGMVLAIPVETGSTDPQ